MGLFPLRKKHLATAPTAIIPSTLNFHNQKIFQNPLDNYIKVRYFLAFVLPQTVRVLSAVSPAPLRTEIAEIKEEIQRGRGSIPKFIIHRP
jgi:hypothetical protein